MGLETSGKLALGSGLAGGLGQLFAPEGQEISSFEGETGGITSLDPGDRLRQAASLAETLALPLANDIFTRKPNFSSSFVQQPPTFSGGGLPFDIGTSVFDQANPFFKPATPTSPSVFGPGANPGGSQFLGGGGGPPGQGPLTDDIIGDLLNQRGGEGLDDPNLTETGPPPNDVVITSPPFPPNDIQGPQARNPEVSIGVLPPPLQPPTFPPTLPPGPGGGEGEDPTAPPRPGPEDPFPPNAIDNNPDPDDDPLFTFGDKAGKGGQPIGGATFQPQAATQQRPLGAPAPNPLGNLGGQTEMSKALALLQSLGIKGGTG